MPCKHRRPGSIPGVSTCAIGIEEDGGRRFGFRRNRLTGGPDVTTCGAAGSAHAREHEAAVRVPASDRRSLAETD